MNIFLVATWDNFDSFTNLIVRLIFQFLKLNNFIICLYVIKNVLDIEQLLSASNNNLSYFLCKSLTINRKSKLNLYISFSNYIYTTVF